MKRKLSLKKIYISPFNMQEIETYLKKKYNCIFERNKIKRAEELIENCPKLMVRPMLLAYIDDLLIDETKNYDYVYEIYNELVFKWIERESVDNKILYKFSEKIAEYMYYKKTIYIGSVEIENLCKDYNIQIRNIEAKSRSLLNRNKDGVYKFAHKSILEYFLAKKAFDDVEFRKNITLQGFDGYDMVEFFLREMSVEYLQEKLQDNPLELKSVSFEFLQLSNVSFSGINILNCDFEGCNLNKAIFSNATFKQVKLRNADLQGADLQGADLHELILSNTDLSETYLMEINFEDVRKEKDQNNFVQIYLGEDNLCGVNLKEACLEMSVWNKSDIEYIISQLKEADFTHLMITEKNEIRQVDRGELFNSNFE